MHAIFKETEHYSIQVSNHDHMVDKIAVTVSQRDTGVAIALSSNTALAVADAIKHAVKDIRRKR